MSYGRFQFYFQKLININGKYLNLLYVKPNYYQIGLLWPFNVNKKFLSDHLILVLW